MSSYFWFLFRIMVSQFFGSLCVLVSVWVFYVSGSGLCYEYININGFVKVEST